MLKVIPVSIRKANEFVNQYHRHHKSVQGAKFAIGAERNGVLVGVAIVGRPVSRFFDDGFTAEVRRLCTDGTDNACSFLYGRAWRVAREMGYTRIVTYTLESENGASLRAAGWTWVGGGARWRKLERRAQERTTLVPGGYSARRTQTALGEEG